MSDRDRAHKLIDSLAPLLGGGAVALIAHGYVAKLPDHLLTDLVQRARAVLA